MSQQWQAFCVQCKSPGFIVMKMPTVGTHFIISPIKLKISFLSRIASCTLFTWTATTDNTSTEIRLNSENKSALSAVRCELSVFVLAFSFVRLPLSYHHFKHTLETGQPKANLITYHRNNPSYPFVIDLYKYFRMTENLMQIKNCFVKKSFSHCEHKK